MIWAVDQDTSELELLTALFGESFMESHQVTGGTLSDTDKEALATKLSGLTGDKCYVTTGCFGPESGPNG